MPLMAGVFIKHEHVGNLETYADAFFSPPAVFLFASRVWVVSLTVGSGNDAEPGGSVNAGGEACAPRQGQMSTQRFHFHRRHSALWRRQMSGHICLHCGRALRLGVNYGLMM